MCVLNHVLQLFLSNSLLTSRDMQLYCLSLTVFDLVEIAEWNTAILSEDFPLSTVIHSTVVAEGSDITLLNYLVVISSTTSLQKRTHIMGY